MMLLPLQGVPRRCTIPQGVALGYELLPLQGEALNTEARSHGEYIFKFSEDTEILKTPWLCVLYTPFPICGGRSYIK